MESVRELTRELLPSAAALLAEAFFTNPGLIAERLLEVAIDGTRDLEQATDSVEPKTERGGQETRSDFGGNSDGRSRGSRPEPHGVDRQVVGETEARSEVLKAQLR